MAITDAEADEAGEQAREAGRRARGTGYSTAEFEQCWYPIALSERLEQGTLVADELCSAPVLVYRDSGGVPRVLARYCKHLGADLSLGDMVGDGVRCSFHHWEWGPDGVCTKVPTEDRVPERARLVSFPTAERWGIVWAFWGLEPTYDVPGFPDYIDSSRLVYRTFEYPETDMADPWWIFTTNVFDLNHLGMVHGLEGLEDLGRTVELDVTPNTIGYGPVVWGVNVDVTFGERPGAAMIGGGTPMAQRGKMKHFMVEACDRGDGSPEALAHAERTIAELHDQHQHQILVEDMPLISTLNFEAGGLLTPVDRAVARYLRYVQDYPRVSMAALAEEAERRGMGA